MVRPRSAGFGAAGEPGDQVAGPAAAADRLPLQAGPELPRPALSAVELRRTLDQLERDRNRDVTRRLATAAAVDDRAGELGARPEQMRARLVVADMSHAAGDVVLGARLALEVNRWAAANGPTSLVARSHLVLSSIREGAGDGAGALDHALRSVELLGPAAPRTRGIHLLRLADALAAIGSYDSARQRYLQAEQVFIEIDDLERRLCTLNNLADTEIMAGDLERAWQVASQLLELAGGTDGLSESAYFDTVASAMLGVGQTAAAEQVARLGVQRLQAGSAARASTPAELVLTLARAERLRGDLLSAQWHLDQCLAICAERRLAGVRVQALGEQAALYAADGRFEQAFTTHQLFHAETMRLTSQQHESAVHARQALYETTEARREAARFWNQARSDPLTGLRNRRYVDEELPRLLQCAADSGLGLLAAIVDADHFKRVNDTYSHQTGDLVIRALAALFSSALEGWRVAGHPDPGFVARLGGEEFLIVLLGPEAEAVTAVERVRAAVHAYGWHPIAGVLPVTVSVGVALAGPQDGQHSLLARADRHLYAAKADGRNRVVADPTGRLAG